MAGLFFAFYLLGTIFIVGFAFAVAVRLVSIPQIQDNNVYAADLVCHYPRMEVSEFFKRFFSLKR